MPDLLLFSCVCVYLAGIAAVCIGVETNSWWWCGAGFACYVLALVLGWMAAWRAI